MIDKLKYRIKFIRKLIPFAEGVKKHFILSGALSIVTIWVSLATPQIYKVFIDRIIIGKELVLLYTVLFSYIVMFVIKTCVAYIKNYSLNKLSNRTLYRLRKKLWTVFLNLKFEDYEHYNTGDIKMRIDDDTNYVAAFADKQTIDYLFACITILITALLLLITDWRLALFAFIVIPITFSLDHLISKKEKVLINDIRENDQNFVTWLSNSLQGWKEIKALNLHMHEQRKFVKYIHKAAIYNSKWINYWVARVLIIPKIKDEFLMNFLLYFFGGLLIVDGKITIGSLLVFIQYYKILSENVNTAATADAELQSNMPFYNRLLDTISTTVLHRHHCNLLKKSHNTVEFNNVYFKYPKTDHFTVENLSFQISEGERVAIVGPSGRGKTTVLKLISGLLEPSSGHITISDMCINDLKEGLLYKKIGFVMQENTLFNWSIRENLLLAKPTATKSEIEYACKKACIYDFIQTLPNKFDTIVGERGVKLSGGQRQRIALARVFLRDADIYLFDEATSGIDQYSEKLINEAICSISEEKTIIVVSHRPSSIAMCNKSINLDYIK